MPVMYYSVIDCFMVSLTLYSKCFNFFVFDFTILCIFPDERSRLVSIKKYGKLRFIRVLGKLYYNPRYFEVTVTASTLNLSSPTHYNNTLPRRGQNWFYICGAFFFYRRLWTKPLGESCIKREICSWLVLSVDFVNKLSTLCSKIKYIFQFYQQLL